MTEGKGQHDRHRIGLQPPTAPPCAAQKVPEPAARAKGTITIKNERAGLNHLFFEVADIDDVFVEHDYLKKLGKYEHMWGLGRHLLGSQVYDYWADTDRLNAQNGSHLLPAEEALISQWGEPPPPKFIDRVCP